MLKAELELARHGRRGFIARQRYSPAQWDEVAQWREYEPRGQPWFGFECVRQLDGQPPEILLVPLPGHTAGHGGIAVSTGAGWLLNAGDAYFHEDELLPDGRHCPPGLRAYQQMMGMDHVARRRNQARVRELAHAHASEVRVFCSHDAAELRHLQQPHG